MVLGVTLLLVGGYGCSETSASPANATCPGQCDSLAASCAVLEAEYGLDCSGCACTIADCADSVAMYGSGAAVLLCGIAIGTLGVKAQSFPVVASGKFVIQNHFVVLGCCFSVTILCHTVLMVAGVRRNCRWVDWIRSHHWRCS